MITVTERAALALEEMALEANAAPEEAIKLVVDGSQVGMMLAEPETDDEIIRHGETTVLIVDGVIAEALDGGVIDCETTLIDGQRKTEFRLLQPSD